MLVVTAAGPDQHHHPFAQEADREHPLLAIVEPRVGIFDKRAGEHRLRIGKVEAAFGQGHRALGWIEGDRHGFMYIR